MKKWLGVCFCFIVNQHIHPPESITTVIFPGETESDVKKQLDRALSTLPFRTLYSYVIKDSSDGVEDLFKSVEISSIDDFPGAEVVNCKITGTWKVKFFLPRDPITKAFVDIEKQVKCLEMLSRSCRGQTCYLADFDLTD